MPALEPITWRGTVLRHLPAGAQRSPLDTRFAARSRENRWNVAGEPTMVFANDRETLEREFATHLRTHRSSELATLVQRRQIFACDIQLSRVFDLMNPATLEALGIRNAPSCFADRSVARATAGFLRYARHAEGLLAPSIAAETDSASWNLVLFLDQIDTPLPEVVRNVRPLAIVQPVIAFPIPS